MSNIFVGADQDIKCDRHDSREIDFAFPSNIDFSCFADSMMRFIMIF
jgi:hypothetical protein